MRNSLPTLRLALTGILLCVFSLAQAGQRPGGHAVASAHPLATDAGFEVLQAGGNAFDAAVAVSAALAVVEPTGSGLGGGGFWLLQKADGQAVFVDGRETAPAQASATMYQDAAGNAIPALSLHGPLAAAIPGTPAGLEHLARRYGRLPLKRSLAPAIRYARDGFACDEELAQAFARNWSRFSPAAKAAFAIDGRAPTQGERIRQADLVHTLTLLAEQGAQAFYHGALADRLTAGVRAAGGIWQTTDLGTYKVVERAPLHLQFRDVKLVTAPPPSAGGVALGQVLGQLDALGWEAESPDATHLLVETIRRAYRDRNQWMGDPDFVEVPVAPLLASAYLAKLAASIDRARATPSASLPPANPSPEGTNTTHFSVLDADGNRVAATLTINISFGSAFMVEGTGVLLNDEMDDFSAAVGAQNAYGLVGSASNAIAPGKRPLSSMTPTFAEGPRGLLVIGTPGGSRIPTMVMLGLLDWIEGADAPDIVAGPRIHHQYLPDVLQLEPDALLPEQRADLQARGHTLKVLTERWGKMNVVTWNPKTQELQAASDPRGVGTGRVSERLVR